MHGYFLGILKNYDAIENRDRLHDLLNKKVSLRKTSIRLGSMGMYVCVHVPGDPKK